jgi:hypothetical protein
MVELAITLSILLLILLVIAEFSIALYDKAVLTNASREGARRGIVAQYPRVSDSEIRDVVKKYAKDYLVTFGPDILGDEDINIDPPDPKTGVVFGDELKITVTYQYKFLVLSRLVAAITGPITLNAITVMKFE